MTVAGAIPGYTDFPVLSPEVARGLADLSGGSYSSRALRCRLTDEDGDDSSRPEAGTPTLSSGPPDDAMSADDAATPARHRVRWVPLKHLRRGNGGPPSQTVARRRPDEGPPSLARRGRAGVNYSSCSSLSRSSLWRERRLLADGIYKGHFPARVITCFYPLIIISP